ncbi:hypothetical protein DEO72_LG4g705 [Vigna unguiculata]|uniref:Uncharacterized protein n=1 Tax=Vigna unguiculata TaxID=3917 RepID=A0A4D6LNG8_VIGUN|nr:hypothetical protein DEO72_LG4g705 [Vigna unguiculata]
MAAAATIFSPATATHQQPAVVSHHLRHLFHRPPRWAPFAQPAMNLHHHAFAKLVPRTTITATLALETCNTVTVRIFFTRAPPWPPQTSNHVRTLPARTAITACAPPQFVNVNHQAAAATPIFFVRTAASSATQHASLAPLHPRSTTTAVAHLTRPPSFTQK